LLFFELAIVSSFVNFVISTPFIIGLLILYKLNYRPFNELSIAECILIGIVMGELTIVLPTVLIEILNLFHTSVFFHIIFILKQGFLIGTIILYFKKGKINMSYLNIKFSLTTLFEYVFLIILLAFYYYLILIIPVDLSFDAVNYYLPYAMGLIKNGIYSLDPFSAYTILGGAPNMPPFVSILYGYALDIIPYNDSFKLTPFLFVLHIVLAGSLLAKEIFPKIQVLWVSIIILIMPTTFIYMTTTPYNTDLTFYAFFISAILFIIKSKKSQNYLWSILAGGSISALILTRDFGLLFLIPILFLIIIGNQKIKKLSIIPLVSYLFIPIALLTSKNLLLLYKVHALLLFMLQIIFLSLIYLSSRYISYEYNTNKKLLLIMLIPAIIFTSQNIFTWGSPILRTQIGTLNLKTTINYSWAANIALYELGKDALPIKAQSGTELLMNIVYIFIAPVLGSLFLLPKIVGIIKCVRHKNEDKMPIILLLLITLSWISIFGGINYSDISTYRHLFDITIILSILSATGIFIIFDKFNIKKNLFPFLMVLIFSIQILTYFNYNPSTFTLTSRIIVDGPFLINFCIYSFLIFLLPAILLKFIYSFKLRIFTQITSYFITMIVIMSILIPTLSIIILNNGSYDKTYKYNLMNLGGYTTTLQIHEYFNSRGTEGKILAYGIDSLRYRTGLSVLDMTTILDLAIVKCYLDGNDPLSTVQKLKDNEIEYIVVPISGEISGRFRKLYRHTNILEILNEPYTTEIERYGYIVIFRISDNL